MIEAREDILGRLEEAISGLKSEFEAAQNDLTRQIAQANDKVVNLLSVVAGRKSTEDAPSIDMKDADLRLLVTRERAEGAATQQIAGLEQTVAELKSEVALLRSQEAWLVTANQDLGERLVMARTEGKMASKNLAAAEAEIQKLNNRQSEKDDQIQALRRQVEHLQDGAPEVVKRLSKEVTSLRYDNARMRAGVEEAEARVEGRETQQRILIEALLSNGRTCRLGDLLVSAGVVTREQLDGALKDQEGDRKRLIGAILVQKGLAREEEVSQAVACQCRVPFIGLLRGIIAPDAARLIDFRTCQEHQCIPVRCDAERVFVAMANPRDNTALAAVEQRSGRRVIPLVATPSDVSSAIRSVYGPH
jgi:peptidoglycan hydrolase CwlO-like protein